MCVGGWQEEQEREHEQLKYVCKCSFLEIYNEQITDLLEPTSTNLQVWWPSSLPLEDFFPSKLLQHEGIYESISYEGIPSCWISWSHTQKDCYGFDPTTDPGRLEDRSLCWKSAGSWGDLCPRCGAASCAGEYYWAPQQNFSTITHSKPSVSSSLRQLFLCTVYLSGLCMEQGAANRKVAATNMNRESSRSHSVFACSVQSTVCICAAHQVDLKPLGNDILEKSLHKTQVW